MGDLEDLIPRSKHDISGIAALQGIDPEAAIPILPQLFAWTRDLNWPVARELIGVLPRFHKQLLPLVRDVLCGRDEMWKLWTLYLVEQFPEGSLRLLIPRIKRMAEKPTEQEIESGASDKSSEILQVLGINQ